MNQVRISLLDSNQCYKLLGLAEGASINEIKDAYRKLVLEYHPDKNILAKDGVRFKMISEAYHTLRLKNNKHVKENYRTEHNVSNKKYLRRKDIFLNFLYSEIHNTCTRCVKNSHSQYVKYEPVFLEYYNKTKRNASILIHYLIRFFLHSRIRIILRNIIKPIQPYHK